MAFSRERVGLNFPFHRGESNFTSFVENPTLHHFLPWYTAKTLRSKGEEPDPPFPRKYLRTNASEPLFLGYFWEKILECWEFFCPCARLLSIYLSNAVPWDFAILCVLFQNSSNSILVKLPVWPVKFFKVLNYKLLLLLECLLHWRIARG